MAITFVDIALVEINGVEMDTIKSFGVDDGDGAPAPMKTMNRERRAKGVTSGVQIFKFTISAAIPAELEIDWHAWKASREAKLIAYEMNDDGRRINLIDCFIESVNEKYDENGESMFDISGFALQRLED